MFIEQTGDLWDFHNQGKWIVITTNGTITKKNLAVMGRGCALEAKTRYPELPRKLAEAITSKSGNYGGNRVYVFSEYQIITFPVKHNWWEKADPILIEQSLKDLLGWYQFIYGECFYPETEKIYIPRAGCGNGHLNWESDVRDLYVKYLDEHYVVLTK